MESYSKSLEIKEKEYLEKIWKKNADLERIEKKLKSI